MPRKRQISPGFFTHAELYEAEALENLPLRLAYAGLWCCADRRGRFAWKPRQLKLDILPYDNVDFPAILNALRKHGFIRHYMVGGKSYGDIPTFLEHQHPHPKEVDSVIPAYPVTPQSIPDASVIPEPSMSHVPPGEPVGCSGPSDVQDLRGASPMHGSSMPPGGSSGRDLVPEDYRTDFDALQRGSHNLESFRMEVATLVRGKHPKAEGATPEEVGRAMRELALAGGRPNQLASFVWQIVKRRREKERDEHARAQVKTQERRKREEQMGERGGKITPLSELLPKLGIVPDQGAA